jgi:hypothetical protein
MLCPAELCDIFECPDMEDGRLKIQVYKDRDDKIFEEKPKSSKKKTSKNKYNAIGDDNQPPPLRYAMM